MKFIGFMKPIKVINTLGKRQKRESGSLSRQWCSNKYKKLSLRVKYRKFQIRHLNFNLCMQDLPENISCLWFIFTSNEEFDLKHQVNKIMTNYDLSSLKRPINISILLPNYAEKNRKCHLLHWLLNAVTVRIVHFNKLELEMKH